MLFGIGVKAAFYYGHAENVSSKPILGITLPLWMGIGGMVLGFLIMLASRPVLQGVLLAQDRNRTAGTAGAAAADRAGAGARGILRPAGGSAVEAGSQARGTGGRAPLPNVSSYLRSPASTYSPPYTAAHASPAPTAPKRRVRRSRRAGPRAARAASRAARGAPGRARAGRPRAEHTGALPHALGDQLEATTGLIAVCQTTAWHP